MPPKIDLGREDFEARRALQAIEINVRNMLNPVRARSAHCLKRCKRPVTATARPDIATGHVRFSNTGAKHRKDMILEPRKRVTVSLHSLKHNDSATSLAKESRPCFFRDGCQKQLNIVFVTEGWQLTISMRTQPCQILLNQACPTARNLEGVLQKQ